MMIIITLMGGCTASIDDELQTSKMVSETNTVKELVESNEYISLPYLEILETKVNNDLIPSNNVIKYKAALYRFYSHVIVDEYGIGTCLTKGGEDLNIDEALYFDIYQNWKLFNEQMKLNLLEGEKIYVTPIDIYLKQLLEENNVKSQTRANTIRFSVPPTNGSTQSILERRFGAWSRLYVSIQNLGSIQMAVLADIQWSSVNKLPIRKFLLYPFGRENYELIGGYSSGDELGWTVFAQVTWIYAPIGDTSPCRFEFSW